MRKDYDFAGKNLPDDRDDDIEGVFKDYESVDVTFLTTLV
jgi:hypothetical protein